MFHWPISVFSKFLCWFVLCVQYSHEMVIHGCPLIFKTMVLNCSLEAMNVGVPVNGQMSLWVISVDAHGETALYQLHLLD